MDINYSNKITFKNKLKLLGFLIHIKIKQLIKLLENSDCSIEKLSSLKNSTNKDVTNYHSYWRKITRTIINKEFITKVEKILYLVEIYNLLVKNTNENNSASVLSKDYKLKSKKFNTIFTIAFFEEIVCGNNVKYKDIIINSSVKLISNLTTIASNKNFNISREYSIYLFSENIDVFVLSFEKWKEFDKEFMLFSLAKQHLLNQIKMSIPLSNSEENQRIYLQAFKREQKAIEGEAKIYFNSDSRKEFDELISNKENYDKVVKNLYWLEVDYSLYKTPPDTLTVLNLFKETKRLMRNLVLKRSDILQEIDETIDDEIIQAVLKEPEVDEAFYYRKCEYILEKLKMLQSAAMDKKLDNFKNDFYKKINNREYFRDLIPYFFRFVLDSLEQIHEQKEAFLEFLKSNKNN